jgi:hypothetical protein
MEIENVEQGSSVHVLENECDAGVWFVGGAQCVEYPVVVHLTKQLELLQQRLDLSVLCQLKLRVNFESHELLRVCSMRALSSSLLQCG